MKAPLIILNLLLAASLIGNGCRGEVQVPATKTAKGSFSGLYEWYGDNEVPLSTPPENCYQRFVWRDLEKGDGQYDFSLIDAAMQAARAKHQKFGFRVMSCWSGEGAVVPDYLVSQMPRGFWFTSSDGSRANDTYVPDWNCKPYLEHVRKLLVALGQHLDGDPALGWVDIGLYGNWGEWHVSGFPYDQHPNVLPARLDVKRSIIDSHIAAFPHSRLLMMTDDPDGLAYALRQSPRIGMRRDSLGDPWFEDGLHVNPDTWALAVDRWKTAPFVTEFYAPSPSGMLALAAQQVPQYHVTLVGNGNTTLKFADMSQGDQTLFSDLQTLAGAWFVVDSARVGMASGNAAVLVNFELRNQGNAPAYEDWNVKCVIRKVGGQPFASVLTTIDLQNLLPSTTGTSSSALIPIPAGLPGGNYEVLLIAQDPLGYLPNQPIGTVIDSATRGVLLGVLRVPPDVPVFK